MKKKEIFEYFIGDWNLDRNLGKQGLAKGTASFKLQVNNNIKYKEEVEITFDHTKGKYKAYREYLYSYDNENNSIVKKFPDGKSFHTLDFDFGSNTVSGSHLCESDNYRALYSFKNYNEFSITYIVKGPSKDYTISTEYIRMLEQESVLIGTCDDVIIQKL